MTFSKVPRVALALVALAAIARPAAAHVDYVTDPTGDTIDAIAFVRETLAEPVNAALFVGSGAIGVVGLALYLRYRPRVVDIEILRAKLATYEDLIPWMLRLSLGLPLVGAGFQGYLFAPTVSFDPAANPLVRVVLIGIGFCLLFGLGTRIMTVLGMGLYVLALAVSPDALLALEYVPGFVALFVLGGGRPSADDILLDIASTEGSIYGRIDRIHLLKVWLDEVMAPYRRYVPTVLRVGLGVSFVFLGVTQKLGDPARSLAVVEKYDLTAVVPVDPGLWVLGAGVLETAVGLALIVGLLTRASAGVAFLLFTATLFGLPDDPVLAHVTLFGMASALVTLGSGPLSLDRLLGEEPAGDVEAVSSTD
ncbi:DoxX family protein [Halomicrobium sp. IBSBa]|uniref:DoxX family protein n=1 Tax=Halomicrobium sp. IBSBa TaxID=2778916 RepID=UPI001ABF99B2|nr:DoxX family protein [Halomicrobium sp. IBSBa]MBO4246336.1 DoxX family protein [Halomicrobium sp. IBSBa]